MRNYGEGDLADKLYGCHQMIVSCRPGSTIYVDGERVLSGGALLVLRPGGRVMVASPWSATTLGIMEYQVGDLLELHSNIEDMRRRVLVAG